MIWLSIVVTLLLIWALFAPLPPQPPGKPADDQVPLIIPPVYTGGENSSSGSSGE